MIEDACEVCGLEPRSGLTAVWRPWGIYSLFTCEGCDEALGGHRKRRRLIGV